MTAVAGISLRRCHLMDLVVVPVAGQPGVRHRPGRAAAGCAQGLIGLPFFGSGNGGCIFSGDAAQQYRWAWWLILYPSLALFSVMLLGVFVGEGVRNAYDPKQYSRLQ